MMDTWGYVILIVGAVAVGFLVEYALDQRLSYAGLLAAIGAVIGGFVASEYLGGLSDWGTELYGMRIFPAIIGAVLVAALVMFATRFVAPAET
jgi:uncharacterized membrane protein YeaQ/YmgE (transglycosylase-associated protein family)